MQPYIKEFMTPYPAMAEGMAREFTVSKDSVVVHRIVNSYKQTDPNIAVPTFLNLYPKAAEAKNKLLLMPFTMKFIMCINPLRRRSFQKILYEWISDCNNR